MKKPFAFNPTLQITERAGRVLRAEHSSGHLL